MTRRLVLAMTGLVALVALGLAVPMALIVDNDQRAALVSDLEVEAMTTASILASEPENEWQATTEAVAERTGARAFRPPMLSNRAVTGATSGWGSVGERFADSSAGFRTTFPLPCGPLRPALGRGWW